MANVWLSPGGNDWCADQSHGAWLLVGVYLAYEAVHRLFQPREIDGWVVIVVAAAALVINLATAAVLHATSRANMNLRAAFLHNVGDALELGRSSAGRGGGACVSQLLG